MDENSPLIKIRYEVLAAVMLGGIVGPIDSSIVNAILPTIAEYFGVSIATIQWVPLIYLLTISSLLLFYGRLGDIFGYKRIYLIGLLSFVIASTLCSLAPTIYYFIAFRAIQGIGGSMMASVPYAILTAVFPSGERGKALGINAISISTGLTLGPTLGGMLASLWSWRFAFLINVPIGIIGFLLARKVIPDLKGQSGRIDFTGAISAFVTLFSLLFFINQVQRTGLNLINSITLIVALIAGVCFWKIENHSPQPMVNLSLFKNRTFTMSAASALLNFASQYVLVFLTPFYLQRVIHLSAGRIGLLMTCFPLATMTVAPFSGVLSDRWETRRLAVTGATICAAALLAMASLSTGASVLSIGWRLAFFGLGTGMFQSPNNSAVMGNVPRPYLGIASGTLSTVRNIGMTIGIASAGLMLYTLVPPAVIVQPRLSGIEAVIFLSGLRYAYILGAIFTAWAAFFSFRQAKQTRSN